MKAFFLVLFVACSLLSCKKNAVTVGKNDLAGTWILKRVTGVIAGVDEAPTDRITLAFDTHGNYSSALNVTITASGTYTITKAANPNDYGSETLLNLFSDNGELTYGMHLNGDSLYLGSACCDQFNYTYTRKK